LSILLDFVSLRKAWRAEHGLHRARMKIVCPEFRMASNGFAALKAFFVQIGAV